MALRFAIVVLLSLLAHTVEAEPTSSYRLVATQAAQGPQVVPDAAAATTALAKSRTIYLNRRGATLTPGTNNSSTNTSTLVPRLVQVPGWNASSADWDAVMSCMRGMWSRFDVTVTDVDPGATPHIEAIFAQSPSDIGMTENIGGVSPFSASCSVIESSIVFAFTNNLPRRPRALCEVMSQEIAHSYGLDHELVASDPMTYLPYAGERSFQDREASCGETSARPCGIAGQTCRATQNSVQLLLSRLGAANRDNTPPSVGIMEPANAARVTAGFAIAATASDNIGVASVAFYVDGELIATRTAPPYELATDPDLAAGAHVISVEAIDTDGNATMMDREIVVGDEPLLGLGCSAGREPPAALLALALVALARRRRTAGQR